ncbi:uncharacterized protein LOC131882742 isoform X2 [Tigriopus californicus]|uniref:uncharacterized protein LOC131882742 isoform X2 n=1 Tax=Tigriopus californicus TaxID=6832 RepID=UPI0027DA9919|nr:uncharacterized protein LOC131882742 isoform X2 [Tigriopus californicus]
MHSTICGWALSFFLNHSNSHTGNSNNLVHFASSQELSITPRRLKGASLCHFITKKQFHRRPMLKNAGAILVVWLVQGLFLISPTNSEDPRYDVCANLTTSEESLECRSLRDQCVEDCTRGLSYGTGFCASFSSLIVPILRAYFDLNFDKAIIPTLSDGLFWSAAYYCTSGSNYYACHKCQAGFSYKDIVDFQEDTYQTLKALPAQSEVHKLTRQLTENMEATRRSKEVDLRFGQTLEDFDNLEFKFNLITLNSNNTVKQDFAFHHFLQSAQFPGKESLEGIYFRIRKMLMDHSHLGLPWHVRKHRTVFSLDKESYCQPEILSSRDDVLHVDERFFR